MQKKYLIFGSILCTALSANAQINVKPLNGVALTGNSRATYVGTGIEYEIAISCEDSIAQVTEFKAGDDNLKYTLEKGKITSVENYTFAAGSVANQVPLTFTLSYTVIEKEIETIVDKKIDEETQEEIEVETEVEVEVEKPRSLPSVTCYATVYSKPADNISIKNNGKDGAAIFTGDFNFEAQGMDLTSGDPDGWTFTWTATESIGKTGASANWTFTNAGTEEKTYIVTFTATNRINGSTDEKYFRTFTKETSVKVYPQIKTTLKSALPENVLVGDEVKFNYDLEGGQAGKWEDVVMVINGEEVLPAVNVGPTSASFAYQTTKHGQYSIEIKAKNHPDNMEEGKSTSSGKNVIDSWSKPETTAPTNTSLDIRRVTDATLDLEFESAGGCTAGTEGNGWRYEWYIDSKLVGTTQESNYRIQTSTLNHTNHEFKVVALNYVDNKERYNKEYKWNVTLWDYPAAPTLSGLDAFFDEEAVINTELHGGYTGQGGGWELTWYKDNEIISGATEREFTTDKFPKGADEDNDYIDNSTYQLVARNYWKDGTLWGDVFSIPVSVIVHPIPEVSFEYEPNAYYNNNFSVTIKEKGGIKTGALGLWSHTITYNNISKDKYGQTEHKSVSVNGSQKVINFDNLYSQNLGNKPETVRVHLISKNGYGPKEKIFENDLDIVVWPQVQFDAKMATDALRVREGDELQIIAPKPISGGYTAEGATSYLYSFSYDGKPVDDEWIEENKVFAQTAQTAGSRMQTRSVPVGCVVYAIGPNKEVWDQKAYYEHATLYRRPDIPQGIVLKGNGTSKTYIFNMKEDDSVLESNVYNYTLVTNNDKVLYFGDKRYGVCNSVTKNEIKGATYWQYSDGTTIYSDFIDFDGNVEPCNWSDFGNRGPVTRAEEVDAIEEVIEDSSDLHLYDIQGRYTARPKKGSLYIKNGKKYIAK